MKLTNIRIYNSKNYHTANLVLDADSVQIAGANNRGKTSLLWTLMFLFVVHRKKATHPNYNEKESLKFYFPSSKSYIIYEGFDASQGYYYLLLRRNGDGIEYYFAKKKFKEEFIMNGKSVLSFEKILENPETGLGKKDASVSETIARNIQKKKDRIGFIRLNGGVKSELFSDLYRHLFRATSNDNDILKNGILIALGYQDESLNFAKLIPAGDRRRWRRDYREIEELKKVSQGLIALKEEKKLFDSARLNLKILISEFEDTDLSLILEKIQNSMSKFNRIIVTNANKLENEVSGNKKNLLIKKDAASKEVGKAELDFNNIEKKLLEAKSYDEKIWIEQEIKNLEGKQQEIKNLMDKIEETQDPDRLNKKIEKLRNRKKQIKNMLENDSDSLILNFSKDPELTAMANAVLSDEVKSLSKDSLSAGTTTDFSFLSICDKKINISAITPRATPTKEELNHELQDTESELTILEKVLENLNKKKELNAEFKQCAENLFKAQGKLKEIDSIPMYEKLVIEKKNTLKEKVDIEIALGSELDAAEKEEKELRETNEKIKKQINDLGRKKERIFNFSIKTEECKKKINVINENASFKDYSEDEVYTAINRAFPRLEERETAYIHAEANFLALIKGMNKEGHVFDTIDIEAMDEHIAELEEKCYKLDVREDNLNENIKMSFELVSQGIKNFLEKIDHVNKAVGKMSRTISRYKISDLTNVKVILNKNERQIKELTVVDPSQADIFSEVSTYDEASKTSGDIGEYIRTNKIILLSDLFTITVEREKNNKKQESQQSNGTERMLHVMLLLITLREMVNKEDVIPFLIDEVADIDSKNQSELLSFFKSLNLLPISASPQVSPQFKKIFNITEYEGKSYLSDRTATWKEEGLGNGKD